MTRGALCVSVCLYVFLSLSLSLSLSLYDHYEILYYKKIYKEKVFGSHFLTSLTQVTPTVTCVTRPSVCAAPPHLLVSLGQSINHGGHTPGVALPRLPYGATPGGHALGVPMQAPFLYRVTPSSSSRRHH